MKQKRIIILAIIILSLSFNFVSAQSEAGVWKTVDDNTGKDKSHVEIYFKNGRMYGKIVKLIDKSGGENPLCTECKGLRKNKPILGMEIVDGLSKRKSDWYLDKGILDPENGKWYDCKIWLENNNTLKVRGYIGVFYRTQTWYRVK